MTHGIADGYRRFAESEAAGVSQTYFDWAMGVAEDQAVLGLIGALPMIKRQPNLVFAAARFVGAPVGGYAEFRDWLIERWEVVVAVIMSRSTQTNEAARCAVLLPLLAELGGPLALIEAGASGGLVLYPDRYSYRYTVDGGSTASLHPADGPSPVEIPCTIDAPSLPESIPRIAWRAGADLNPIDVADADQLAWLETLVWPEHAERRERLHRAAEIVASDPPHLVAGDIIDRIPELVAQAPADCRVVVFHSAVLVYLTEERRNVFVDLMRSMDDVHHREGRCGDAGPDDPRPRRGADRPRRPARPELPAAADPLTPAPSHGVGACVSGSRRRGPCRRNASSAPGTRP